MADLSVTAASVVFSNRATKRHGTAGAAITIGQAVYHDVTDGKWKLALSTSAIDDVEPGQVGIAATEAAADGQDIVVAVADPECTPGGTLAVGAPRWVSGTAGGLAETADLASGARTVLMLVPLTTTTAVLQPTVGGTVA